MQTIETRWQTLSNLLRLPAEMTAPAASTQHSPAATPMATLLPVLQHQKRQHQRARSLARRHQQLAAPCPRAATAMPVTKLQRLAAERAVVKA